VNSREKVSKSVRKWEASSHSSPPWSRIFSVSFSDWAKSLRARMSILSPLPAARPPQAQARLRSPLDLKLRKRPTKRNRAILIRCILPSVIAFAIPSDPRRHDRWHLGDCASPLRHDQAFHLAKSRHVPGAVGGEFTGEQAVRQAVLARAFFPRYRLWAAALEPRPMAADRRLQRFQTRRGKPVGTFLLRRK